MTNNLEDSSFYKQIISEKYIFSFMILMFVAGLFMYIFSWFHISVFIPSLALTFVSMGMVGSLNKRLIGKKFVGGEKPAEPKEAGASYNRLRKFLTFLLILLIIFFVINFVLFVFLQSNRVHMFFVKVGILA